MQFNVLPISEIGQFTGIPCERCCSSKRVFYDANFLMEIPSPFRRKMLTKVFLFIIFPLCWRFMLNWCWMLLFFLHNERYSEKLKSKVSRMKNFQRHKNFSFCSQNVIWEQKLKARRTEIKINRIAHRVGIARKEYFNTHKNCIRTFVQREQRNSRRSIVQDRYDEIDVCWVCGEAGREWKEDDGTRKIIKLCTPNVIRNGKRSEVTVIFVRR